MVGGCVGAARLMPESSSVRPLNVLPLPGVAAMGDGAGAVACGAGATVGVRVAPNADTFAGGVETVAAVGPCRSADEGAGAGTVFRTGAAVVTDVGTLALRGVGALVRAVTRDVGVGG